METDTGPREWPATAPFVPLLGIRSGRRDWVAGGLGFEPRLTESKSAGRVIAGPTSAQNKRLRCSAKARTVMWKLVDTTERAARVETSADRFHPEIVRRP